MKNNKKSEKPRRQIPIHFADANQPENPTAAISPAIPKDHQSRLVFYASLSSASKPETTRIKRPRVRKAPAGLDESVRKFAQELEATLQNDETLNAAGSASELELALDKLKLSRPKSNAPQRLTSSDLSLLRRNIAPKK